MKSNKLLGSVYLMLAAGIWGGMFVVVKAVVDEIPPIQLVWLRYLVGALMLWLLARWQKIQWHWDRRNLGLIFLIGLIGDTISIVAQETGTWLSSAQLGSVVTTATPAFMILFSWPLLKMRPHWYHWFSLILASAGVIAIVGFQFTGGRHLLLGASCLFLAGLTWALMSVLVQLVDPKYDIIQITFLATVVAIICLTPLVLAKWSILTTIHWTSPHVSLSILYLGAISTALAFFLWNKGLRLFKNPSAGVFFLVQPVVGTVLGWLFLQEQITVGFYIGLFLILMSILVTSRFD